jgi:hypothetical protein
VVSNVVTDYTPSGQLFYLGHAKLETKGQSAPIVLPQAGHAKKMQKQFSPFKEAIYSSPSSKAHSKIHEKHS